MHQEGEFIEVILLPFAGLYSALVVRSPTSCVPYVLLKVS